MLARLNLTSRSRLVIASRRQLRTIAKGTSSAFRHILIPGILWTSDRYTCPHDYESRYNRLISSCAPRDCVTRDKAWICINVTWHGFHFSPFQITVFGVFDATARIDVSNANWMLNIFAIVYLLCNATGINRRAMTSITVLVRLDWWHAIEYTLTSVKCSHSMLLFIRWTSLV